jgi:hypothetical protein
MSDDRASLNFERIEHPDNVFHQLANLVRFERLRTIRLAITTLVRSYRPETRIGESP